MLNILHLISLAIVVPVVSTSALIPLLQAFGQTHADNLYSTKSLTLPPNIKHFVILIPDEAHESLNQPKDQYPFINQAYLPQHARIL